ncbi:hypothetical protein [Hymenobacter ruber]
MPAPESNPFADLSPAADFAAQPVEPARIDPIHAVQSLDGATWDKMAFYYDYPEQRPRGATTFVPELDAHFKWMPGYTNLWTGWPGSGKSEFMRQLLLLQAVFGERKSLLFAPEDMPKESLYDALIHSLTGQNPDPEVPGHLPRAYYHRAAEYIREFIYVVVCPKTYGKTPGHILDVFESARAQRGISHFVLDPWNKCDHSGMQAAGGFQPYLVKELGAFTDWSVETQAYLNIVAHPKGQIRPRGEARAVPDSDGVSGGATWDDMMHCINAIYRPNVHKSRNDPAVAFYNHKIKSHRRMGAKPGSIGQDSENPDVLIEFDWKTARYTFNGITPLSAPAVQSIYAPELVALTQAPPTPTPTWKERSIPAASQFEHEPSPYNIAAAAPAVGIRFGPTPVAETDQAPF